MADSFGSAIAGAESIIDSEHNLIRSGKRRAVVKNQPKHQVPLVALETDSADVQLRARLFNERLEIVQPRAKNMRDLIGQLDKLIAKMCVRIGLRLWLIARAGRTSTRTRTSAAPSCWTRTTRRSSASRRRRAMPSSPSVTPSAIVSASSVPVYRRPSTR